MTFRWNSYFVKNQKNTEWLAPQLRVPPQSLSQISAKPEIIMCPFNPLTKFYCCFPLTCQSSLKLKKNRNIFNRFKIILLKITGGYETNKMTQ